MSTWRCPHCATPQPESSRCWVCRRSSTCCATCRHFRRSIAERLGFCGLDPRRAALRGDELRPCWEGAPLGLAAVRPMIAVDVVTRTPVRTGRSFVPVEARSPGAGSPVVASVQAGTGDGARSVAAGQPAEAAGPAGPVTTPVQPPASGGRWGLFPELD